MRKQIRCKVNRKKKEENNPKKSQPTYKLQRNYKNDVTAR